jgi:hypothetical protein
MRQDITLKPEPKSRKRRERPNQGCVFKDDWGRTIFQFKSGHEAFRTYRKMLLRGRKPVPPDASAIMVCPEVSIAVGADTYGLPKTDGTLINNYARWVGNNHPVLSICWADQYHPFSRFLRCLVNLSYLSWVSGGLTARAGGQLIRHLLVQAFLLSAILNNPGTHVSGSG